MPRSQKVNFLQLGNLSESPKKKPLQRMCAVLLLVQLLALVQATQAYVKGPRLYMCETLHVAHGQPLDVRPEDVALILREVTSPGNDSEEVECFLPSQEYTGR